MNDYLKPRHQIDGDFMRSLCVLVACCCLLGGCSTAEPLDASTLEKHQERFAESAVTDYRLRLRTEGEAIEGGVFEAVVRQGKVVSLLRDELEVTPTSFYSISGLYEFLLQELDIAAKPHLYLGGSKTSLRLYQRIKYDAQGVPIDYYRTAAGAKHSLRVQVLDYAPL